MKILQIFFALCFLSVSAQAQNTSPQTPIEISADQNLEWRQKDKQYIANGNVEAKQGDIIILADKLIADYKENVGGKTEIWRLTATGNVQLRSGDSIVTGGQAVYLVETGAAEVTGKFLQLTTPNETITALNKLTYNSQTLIATARGDAEIVQKDKKLNAEIITANFVKNSAGKQVLKNAKAKTNVRITTPDEILTGNNGVYNAQNNTAEVQGNVKIKRGPNILEGARAEVNLTTNLSKMFGAPEKGTRVKATFFPGSEKEQN